MVLNHQIHELVAIGASISANCQPCLEYHVAKARKLGVSETDITGAIDTGRLVRQGAADKMDKFAPMVTVVRTPEALAIDKECGCGA